MIVTEWFLIDCSETKDTEITGVKNTAMSNLHALNMLTQLKQIPEVKSYTYDRFLPLNELKKEETDETGKRYITSSVSTFWFTYEIRFWYSGS